MIRDLKFYWWLVRAAFKHRRCRIAVIRMAIRSIFTRNPPRYVPEVIPIQYKRCPPE